MSTDNKRLLLEIDTSIRDINRRAINPVITELKLSDLHPVIEMVARARADYLRAFFELAAESPPREPTNEAIAELARLRGRYEELVKAMQALETAIEREYLDVRKR
ncbi:MAG: hypothetical protein JXM75_01860 [Chromatiaceae bacterium]|nr:hypothetical protein [Chromatiaceae bacterium]